MELNKLFVFGLCLVIFANCEQYPSKKNNNHINPHQQKDEHPIDDDVEVKISTLNKDNVLFEKKVYQYPEILTIAHHTIRIKGHEKETQLDLKGANIQFTCEDKFETEITDLVSWDFQKPDFVIPGYCFEGDSLILSSKPRVYRGDRPNAWVFNAKSNTKYIIDTRYFNDIISIIQIKKDQFLVLFDYGTHYRDDKYSIRYAILKLDR